MELKISLPQIKARAVFTIHKPTCELLVRWRDDGPGRRRGKIVLAKDLPHPGWGQDELDGRRLLKVADLPAAEMGQILDLDLMDPGIVRAIEAGKNPTLLPRELVWKEDPDGGPDKAG